MHARGLHAVDAADRAGELAFQRPQVIDVLDEGRRAERVGFVEDLVADPPPFGRPDSASFMRRRATLSLGTMMIAPSLLS